MSNDDERERTKGGSIVYQHAPRAEGWTPPADGDEHWMRAIEEHVARHVAPVDVVFHEIVSDLVHLDVHLVPPGARNPYWMLFTTGMSARPMTMPPGAPGSPYAELAILLPPEWRCDQESWKDERWYWPVRWLKTLARLPHEYRTWLSHGHTIPNGDPARPFDRSTALSGMIVFPSISLTPEAQQIPVGDLEIDLWTLWPLHADEMQYKLDHGADALIDLFESAGVRDVIDPDRPSVVKKPPRKKLFGIF